MGVNLDETVDACMQWLGEQAKTLAEHPSRTLDPIRAGGDQSWSRAEALLADALEAEGTPLAFGETLGEGGEGIVHLAEQRSLGRLVAVKTLRPSRRSPTAVVSLLREAWLLGRLEHPNILPVHDLRIDDAGRPQVVLKRIEGVAWADIIADEHQTRERFDVDLFEHNLEVLLQLCQAVRFAHSRGVIHRDLKPDNVMIGAFGEVYLLDWGIAVVKNDDGYATDYAPAGTPFYMAPEMIGAGEVVLSDATDVYLLGAILYEITCGHPPHRADDSRAIIASIVASPPAVPSEVPRDLASLMRAAMHVDPDRRPTVEDFRGGLLDHRRHRTSNALADEASSRLEDLERLAATEEANLERAYDAFGACRFGFQQALETWPGNDRAAAGLRRAACAMVRLELDRGDAEAARAQLEAIDDPPEELTAAVEEALARRTIERQRIEALEHLGDQHDTSTGRNTRLFVVLVIGLLWSVSPIIAWVGEQHGYRQAYPGTYAPLTYLVVLGIAYARYREVIDRTLFNRRTVGVIAIGLTGMLVFTLGAVALGLSRLQMRALHLLVASMAAAAASLAIDRRFWVPTASYALGFLLCATWWTSMTAALLTQSVTHFVTTGTMYLMWRRSPEGLERYGIRR